MKAATGFYHWLVGIITSITVTVISGVALWQKAPFWEAFFWQLLILLCLAVTSAPTALQDPIYSKIEPIRERCLWVLLLLIFVLSWRVRIDIFFIYTIVWVGVSTHYLSARGCWAWLLAINVGWFFVREYIWQEQQALVETLLVATFHMFALMSSLAAREAAQVNEKTQQLNRELLATQHLLSEASRENERTRIARDLHDLLGHHLTALTINLQVAGHIASGEAKEKVGQCYALAKLLLSDVRDAVSELRSMPLMPLKELLEIAVKDIPRLEIELKVDSDLQIDDVNTAEALLRMVQEAITNTLKHTHAKRAKVCVETRDNCLVLSYTDNGAECKQFTPGNGLNGMRERLEKLGGDLDIAVKPTMCLTASVPFAT